MPSIIAPIAAPLAVIPFTIAPLTVLLATAPATILTAITPPGATAPLLLLP